MTSQDPVPLRVVLGAIRPHSGGSLSISWDAPAGFGAYPRNHKESKQQPSHAQGPVGRCSHLLMASPPQLKLSILAVTILQPCLRASEPGQGYTQGREWSRSDPAPNPVPSEVMEPQSLPWLCPLNP